MITKIQAQERYTADHGWLTSYHLFSFAEYYDPKNMNFGVLRVFNDDTIDRESGFGPHPHRDMEIVTIILEGELTHEDSMGNTKVIRKGEVQYMSAGTGVIHSEMNYAPESVHLYQLWFTPRTMRLPPMYDQRDFSEMEKNMLVLVVSGEKVESSIHFQSDATVYLCELEAGKNVAYEPQEGRGVFIYVTRGTVEIGGIPFSQGDQGRVIEESALSVTTTKSSAFILIDVCL